jgi:hypothetical protein
VMGSHMSTSSPGHSTAQHSRYESVRDMMTVHLNSETITVQPAHMHLTCTIPNRCKENIPARVEQALHNTARRKHTAVCLNVTSGLQQLTVRSFHADQLVCQRPMQAHKQQTRMCIPVGFSMGVSSVLKALRVPDLPGAAADSRATRMRPLYCSAGRIQNTCSDSNSNKACQHPMNSACRETFGPNCVCDIDGVPCTATCCFRGCK